MLKIKDIGKDEQGFICVGGIAMFILMVAILAATIGICMVMQENMGAFVEENAFGRYDAKVLDADVVTRTYTWASGIVFACLGLGIIGIAFCYFTGIFSPEAAAKAKTIGMKFIMAVCFAPVIAIPLRLVIELNKALCGSFLGMAGGWSIASGWSVYFGTGGYGWYKLMPFFAIILLGLSVTVVSMLIFRLIIMMVVYVTSPWALVLCVFPQTREFGSKLFKIFFEAVFMLLFFDITLVFIYAAFDIFGGVLHPFVIAFAGLAAIPIMWKLLFNPIGKAMSGAAGAAAGAVSGFVAGTGKLGGAAGGLGGFGKGAGKGAGVGAGAGGADKAAGIGADLMQQGLAGGPGGGMGVIAGAALGGGALIFKGAKATGQAVQAGRMKYGEWQAVRGARADRLGAVAQKKGFGSAKEWKQKDPVGHGYEKDKFNAGVKKTGMQLKQGKDIDAARDKTHRENPEVLSSQESKERGDLFRDKKVRDGLEPRERSKLEGYKKNLSDGEKLSPGAQKEYENLDRIERGHNRLGQLEKRYKNTPDAENKLAAGRTQIEQRTQRNMGAVDEKVEYRNDMRIKKARQDNEKPRTTILLK